MYQLRETSKPAALRPGLSSAPAAAANIDEKNEFVEQSEAASVGGLFIYFKLRRYRRGAQRPKRQSALKRPVSSAQRQSRASHNPEICALAVASTKEVAMRNALILAVTPVVLMTGVALSTPAVAAHALSGTWSRGSIKQHCDAAGGHFNSDGGYGCTTVGGQVSCQKNGKCIGTDPSRLVPTAGNKPTGGGTVVKGGGGSTGPTKPPLPKGAPPAGARQ